MKKNVKIVVLVIIVLLIGVCLSLGITKAFMKPIVETESVTAVDIDACAKLTLTGESSINLTNSYAMSRNRALQNTPYSLKVVNSCDDTTSYSLYVATVSTNTVEASNIHYILTSKGTTTVVEEGILGSATTVTLSDSETTELNAGIGATVGAVYQIHTSTLESAVASEMDLYLYVDSDATTDTAGKTFVAAIAAKAS